MWFVFDYKETLERRVTIESENLGDAILKLHSEIDNENIVLDSSDFAGAEITMPLTENLFPQLLDCGNEKISKEGLDILIDVW